MVYTDSECTRLALEITSGIQKALRRWYSEPLIIEEGTIRKFQRLLALLSCECFSITRKRRNDSKRNV